MPIQIPRFEKKNCLAVTACGRLKGEGLPGRGKIREEKPRVARYQTKSGTAFVRAWLGGRAKRHLHVDCALQTFFGTRQRPKATHKKAEVLKVVEGAIGAQIDVSLRGCFEVPLAELPERGIIRSLAREQKTLDMSIRLTGGSLSLTGAPIKKVHWTELKDNNALVSVTIEGERTATVSERYMCEMWEWINDEFSLFILGKRKDGKA